MVSLLNETVPSYFISDAGISDNILSHHYDDLTPIFYGLNYVNLAKGDQFIEVLTR